MAVSLEQFVRHLTDSGLLSAAEVSSFQDGAPPEKRPKDAESLARDLVRASKLTKYQAQAVYQGKIKGLMFGEYRVLDKLGEGGMGVVLLAEHRRMERRVAVKRISGAALRSPAAVKRFYQEVKAAARLMHPNIVAAHDAGEHEGGHYLVMEYVEGKDLAALADERGPLPVTQAVDYVLQAARGLEYAHKQGIVHRDIKPSNLLLDKEGHVKILDMGLARIGGSADSDEKDRLTAFGKVMGTCDYIAPEQAMDARTADHRADIYSLGCTLYRLMTGKPPYEGDSLVQILLAHREAPIPSLARPGSDMDVELDRIFQKMVAKRPEDRYQSMAEVVAALEAFGHRGPAEWSAGQAVDWGASPSQSASRESRAASPADFSIPLADAVMPARQTVERGEGTLARGAALGSGRRPRRSLVKRFLAAARKPETRVATIGLGLLGLAGVVFIAFLVITIRVHHPDGTETSVTVPSGSQVTVSPQGDVEVALKAEGGRPKAVGPAVPAESGTARGTVGPVPPAASGTSPGAAGKAGPTSESGQPKVEGEKPKAEASSPVPPSPAPQPPSPGVAPYDPAKAKEHQAAAAKQLGVPVLATNSIGMKLVLIPPGEFDMGSSAEETAWALQQASNPRVKAEIGDALPRHHVKLTKAFYLGMYLVTQDEYTKVMRVNPSSFSAKQAKSPAFDADKKMRASMARAAAGRNTGNYPVEEVAWVDCVEFCRRLSAAPAERAAGRVYRLTTEAEWEYACRAETTTRWYFGDNVAEAGEYAWFLSNSGGISHPVGQKKPNAWELYDMHGLVWQWCRDWFGAYRDSPAVDPTGPERGENRVLRGGCFRNGVFILRSASRTSVPPNELYHARGFRVALEIANQQVGPAVPAETGTAPGTAGKAGPTGSPPPARLVKTSANLLSPAKFTPFEKGGERQGEVFLCDNGGDTEIVRGFMQKVHLGQTRPEPIFAVAYSKAEGVSGEADSDYSLFVTFVAPDKTFLPRHDAAFSVGTHDWERREVYVMPEKPIADAYFYYLFRRHGGKAWFKGGEFYTVKAPEGGAR